jgi:hypothetical protein
MIYEWSEQIDYYPWVGYNFNNSLCKVLLIGEGHSGENQPNKWYTQYVIQKWCINQKHPGGFFAGIIWTLFGNNNNEDIEDKYNEIAFYNCIQLYKRSPRVRQSATEYEATLKSLVEVFEKLLPDIVITFGKDMAWHLPCIAEKDNWKKDIAGEKHVVWANSLSIGNRSIPVYSLPHPCAGIFNRRVYYQYFLELGIVKP